MTSYVTHKIKASERFNIAKVVLSESVPNELYSTTPLQLWTDYTILTRIVESLFSSANYFIFLRFSKVLLFPLPKEFFRRKRPFRPPPEPAYS